MSAEVVEMDNAVSVRRGDYTSDAACQLVIDELKDRGWVVTSEEWREPLAVVPWRTAMQLGGVRLTPDMMHVDTFEHRGHRVSEIVHEPPRQGVRPVSRVVCSCGARLVLWAGPKS